MAASSKYEYFDTTQREGIQRKSVKPTEIFLLVSYRNITNDINFLQIKKISTIFYKI